MKIPEVIFRFQTEQTTSASLEAIKYEILQKLKEYDYRVTAVTTNSVTFKEKPGMVVTGVESKKLLSGGEFLINQLEYSNTLVFNYRINILPGFVILFIVLTFCIIERMYSGIPFFGGFFLIASVFQYFSFKTAGKEILDEIITEAIDIT
ncbi:MAG: hypothetical protein ABI367_07350 [Mucilaginibacter sp.]